MGVVFRGAPGGRGFPLPAGESRVIRVNRGEDYFPRWARTLSLRALRRMKPSASFWE